MTLSTFRGFSQEMVNYKILEDDPTNVSNFWVSLDFLNFDLNYITLMPINLGVRASADLKKIASFDLAYRKCVLNILSAIDPNKNANIPDYYVLELGGALNFSDKVKNRTRRLVLSSSTSGKYQYTKYINVPCQVRRIQNMSSPIEFKDITTVAPTKAYNEDNSGIKHNMYFKYNMTGFYAGISSRGITQLRAETDYGRRNINESNTLAFDVMIMPYGITDAVGNKKDEIKVKKDETNETIILKDGLKMGIGWRFVWDVKMTNPNKLIGLTMRCELGSTPGVRDGDILQDRIFSTGYMAFTMGLSIQRKLGILAIGRKAPKENEVKN